MCRAPEDSDTQAVRAACWHILCNLSFSQCAKHPTCLWQLSTCTRQNVICVLGQLKTKIFVSKIVRLPQQYLCWREATETKNNSFGVFFPLMNTSKSLPLWQQINFLPMNSKIVHQFFILVRAHPKRKLNKLMPGASKPTGCHQKHWISHTSQVYR